MILNNSHLRNMLQINKVSCDLQFCLNSIKIHPLHRPIKKFDNQYVINRRIRLYQPHSANIKHGGLSVSQRAKKSHCNISSERAQTTIKPLVRMHK